jgi:hypothetical protein
MVAAEEFTKYCSQTLEVNFGDLSNEILYKIKSKKSLNDKSNANDLEEFIDLIEVNVALFSGKHKAQEIGNILRLKAREAEQVLSQKSPEFQISADIDKEINLFLSNNSLPTDADITDYAKYLTMKYGGNAKSLEKGLCCTRSRMWVTSLMRLDGTWALLSVQA